MPWRRPTERRELVHVVVTGYQKRKYPRKFYVFVIDVTWNNNERSEIYRRYSEFFSFQTTLKALFPDAAGRRSGERTIPQLPKRIFVGRSHVAKVAEARVEQINRYCQTLVSLDVNVSQSSHVIGFFSPRIGDISLPKLHLHRPASLHPMKIPAGSLFEEYCALAEYQGDDPSQISFTSGQVVLVLAKDSSGWWMCKVKDQVGWAPPSYLKKVDRGGESGESDSDDDYLGLPEDVDSEREGGGTDSGISSVGETVKEQISEEGKGFNVPEIEFQEYKAIDSYEAQGDGQVSFEEGDIIQVLDKIEDGWWFVAKGQEEGWVPCSYLEPLNGGQEEDDTISSLDVEHYITIEKYTAEEQDELSFPKGVKVDVLQKSLDGWWLIKYEGKAALAPATFLVKETTKENSSPGGRKPSVPNVAEPQEESGETKEKTNTLTREFFKQPPRKESVRKRVTIRKSKQKDNPSARPANGLKAPPTIREESPSRAASSNQPRKLSLESADPTNILGGPPLSAKHSKVMRKLSDVPQPTQEQVEVNPKLPGQRKISLDAALSGAPMISPNGSLVHQLNKATIVTSSITSSTTTADSDTEEHEYFNIANTQAYLRERREQKMREMRGRNPTSPTTSDSEVEREASTSWTGRPAFGPVSGSGTPSGRSREVQSRIHQWERRLSSDSEDGVSSPTRRPVATPRARKPDLKPKPDFSQQQQVPPRPRQSQISRARVRVGVGGKKEGPPPVIEEQGAQPHMPPRPRGTEIRRARQGKPLSAPNTPAPPQSPSPSTTPTITATNDEGDHKVVLSPNKNSAFRPISNRHSPSPGLASVTEERSEDAGTTPSALGLKAGNRRPRSPRGKSPSRSPSPAVSATTAGESLAPPKPSRRDRNDSETRETPPSPSPSSPSPASSPMISETTTTTMTSSDEGGNPFNQQMAETLIKYVLASQDAGLKNALRECIMSNPEAVKALQQ